MRELLAEYDHLRQHGGPVGRAVVTSVWGSAPRAVGACTIARRPIGLDLGGRQPGKIALATTAEITMARYGGG